MMSRPLFVLDDDDGVVRTIRRLAPHDFDLRVARSVEEARALLDDKDVAWAGFLVDVQLSDDAEGGLHVLRAIRRIAPTRPAVLLTASREPRVVNVAAGLDANVLLKPVGAEELAPFFERARESTARRVFAAALGAGALTAREQEIVLARYDGLSDEAIALREGLARKTVESHVRAVLRKTGTPTVRDLVAKVRKRS